jgi:hypothetical protein
VTPGNNNAVSLTDSQINVGRFVDNTFPAAMRCSALLIFKESLSASDDSILEKSHNAYHAIPYVAPIPSVYLITQYDQSGNGNNATQSVATDQAIVVNAGQIVTLNGEPAAQVSASAMTLTTPLTGTTFSATNVFRFSGSVSNSQVLYGSGGFNFNYFFEYGRFAPGDIATSTVKTLPDTNYVGSQDILPTQVSQTINGTQAGLQTVANYSANVATLWTGISAKATTGIFATEIFFTTARSAADRQTLDRSLGQRYGVTVA